MASRQVEGAQNSTRTKKSLVLDSALLRERKFVLLKKEKQSSKDRKQKGHPPSLKRGRESTFWKNVKSITPNIFWTRIETYGTPGIPDLLGVFISKKYNKNISFWCELKLTKVNKLDLSPFQISWNLKRYSLCQDNFIMAKGVEERAIYFWPGAVARELSVNFKEVEPLFTVHQPWTLELEPALERVLVPVPE
jgi:hypothetical protein